MILDAKELFSEDQALTSVGTAQSTNQIDFNVTNPNKGAGTPVWLVSVVSEAFTSGGAATLDIHLRDSADNSTYAAILKSAQFALADLTLGKSLLKVPLPADFRRYLDVGYVVATAAFTGGKVNTFLTLTPEAY